MATRRKYLDSDVELAILNLMDRGLAPIQIHEQLKKISDLEGKVPNLRTVQRRCQELRPRDNSGTWSWRDGGVEDVRGVLDVLQQVIRFTEGRQTTFTNREAVLIDKVLQASPGLEKWSAYLLARWALRCEAQETSTEALDALLIYQPWKKDHRGRYDSAVHNGWVPSLIATEYILRTGEIREKEDDIEGND